MPYQYPTDHHHPYVSVRMVFDVTMMMSNDDDEVVVLVISDSVVLIHLDHS